MDATTERLVDYTMSVRYEDLPIETVIAALDHDERALAAESADLLYHLLVLWAARGLDPSQVWDALAAREGISGLVEKAARKED